MCNFSNQEILIKEEALLSEIAQEELIVQNYKEVEPGNETLGLLSKRKLITKKAAKPIGFAAF